MRGIIHTPQQCIHREKWLLPRNPCD